MRAVIQLSNNHRFTGVRNGHETEEGMEIMPNDDTIADQKDIR